MLLPVAALGAAVSLLCLNGTPAHADVLSGDSYGFGLQLQVNSGTGAELKLLGSTTGLVGANASLGRLPASATGVAPNPYNTGPQSTVTAFASGNLAAVSGLSLLVAPLSTASAAVDLVGVGGVFNGSALSTVDGLSGPKTAMGTGSVANLQLDLINLGLNATTALGAAVQVDPPPLVRFTQAANTTLSSTSTVSGDAFALSTVGSSLVADLLLSVNGAAGIQLSSLLTGAGVTFTTDVNGNISVAPNTKLSLGVAASGAFPGLGSGLLPGLTLGSGSLLELTLNKQTLSGNPNLNPSITTTALDIQLIGLNASVGIAGLASLDTSTNLGIALGQSHASLSSFSAVPEPSNLFYGCLLLGMVAVSRWRMTGGRRGCGESDDGLSCPV